MTTEHGHHEHEHHEHRPFEHAAEVLDFRARKDAFLQSVGGSPIPEAERETFTGLPCYPVDPRLRFDDLLLVPVRGGRTGGRLDPDVGLFRLHDNHWV